jgi:PhnB protein
MPTPYLFFDGRCEEAIEFYKKALGAKVEMMMRFKDSPEPPPPGRVAPGSDNKIMHSCLSINGESVMASDGCAQGKPKFEGFSLSVNAKDEAEADRVFAADAARQDVLRQALRHGRRPLRRRLDDHRGGLRARAGRHEGKS